jgi:hypothetical protein
MSEPGLQCYACHTCVPLVMVKILLHEKIIGLAVKREVCETEQPYPTEIIVF